MQTTDTYLGLLRERGKQGLPLARVYRQLFNKQLYLTAYGKIYRNAGAMTKGVTEETVDSMSLEKIEDIIKAVRFEQYQWRPARRTYIAKRNGKKRPLGLPVWSDKLLAEVIRLILNAYYDVQFSPHSHGFREGRGCHTALQEIYHTWGNATWIIEGDISDCFGSLPHEQILALLRANIHDGRFLHLVKKLLDAGYLEEWKYHQTLSGVPQGALVSPILSNILLDHLDKFVETVLMPQYTQGKTRKLNQEYRTLQSQMRTLFSKGQKEAACKMRKRLQTLPSINPRDPDYRRLKYSRYADDFGLAFTGPKSEAEEIKRQVATFLREKLGLTLSEEKTLITHARSKAARFLGYEITTLQSDTKQRHTTVGDKRRSINGKVGLRVPQAVILDKRHRYQQRGKPVHRPQLLQESDFTIISTYQLEYRGIVNYYRHAYNLHRFHTLQYTMEASLTKTLAHKHKTSVGHIHQKYRTRIQVEGKTYRGLRATIKREGKEPLIATWGGIPLTWDIRAALNDRPQPIWHNRSELEQRLLAQVCEYCGATRMTDLIEVHHIRALKDLNKYEGRDKPGWVKMMAARRRKTIVLCHTCHTDLHAGRPMKKQRSRSRTELLR